MRRFNFLIVAIFVLFGIEFLIAKQMRFPRPSPNAKVTQTVGVTEIAITYSSPGVKGRTIWGDLVPYGKMWRTGANENTTITFSDDVMVEGNKLAAGTYGLHTIPGENEWAILFSNNSTSWGSFSYKEEEEALRVTVKPQKTKENRERLNFNFDNMTDNSVQVALRWEKLKVAFNVETDVQGIVLASAKSLIRWQGPYQAANYCMQNNINHEEALQWIDLSISMKETYQNLSVKAQLLGQTGKKKDAVKVMEKAIEKGKDLERKPRNLSDMESLLAEWKK